MYNKRPYWVVARMKKSTICDTSEELLIQQRNNGVNLIRPEALLNIFPCGIFWKNTDSVFIGCDRQFALLAGLCSPKDIIGKTDFDLPWDEAQATEYRRDDNTVVDKGTPKLNIEEKFILADGSEFSVLTNKTPLFSPGGEVMGVFGVLYDTTKNEYSSPSIGGIGISACSTILSPLAEPLYDLISSGRPAIPHQIENQQNQQLARLGKEFNSEEVDTLVKKLSQKSRQLISKREAECFFYLIRGKSARETGMALHLSQRTVEFYLDSLRDKLNCRKKSELIEKFYHLL